MDNNLSMDFSGVKNYINVIIEKISSNPNISPLEKGEMYVCFKEIAEYMDKMGDENFKLCLELAHYQGRNGEEFNLNLIQKKCQEYFMLQQARLAQENQLFVESL